MKVYSRKCKICGIKYLPHNAGQVVCTYKCAIEYGKKAVVKEKKAKVKEVKEKIKSKSDYLRELQTLFNKFIRLRDKDKPCISCGREIKGVRHASHYLSVGGHPSVRFNEDNVWVSCYKCNVWLSGNQLEYRKRLIEQIGIERVELVESFANKPRHYSISEIQELKDVYKKKIRLYE